MRKVYGVGVNNFHGAISLNGVHIREYKIWTEMLRRCYSIGIKVNRPSYTNCIVDDWLLDFSNFYKFARDQIGFFDRDSNGKSFHLDKDILGNGKLYSTETICFIPPEINAFKTNRKSTKGEYPIGVLFHKASGKLISQITVNSTKKYLGVFDNPYDAFSAYKVEKEKQSKFLAEKYKSVIDPRVYQALIDYEVNIDD